MSRYADYDDLIRGLDEEGLSDDQFGPALDDEDLALLSEIAPDKPRPRPAAKSAVKSAPKKTPAKRKPAAKKP